MICKKCGKEILETAKFCEHCGYSTSEETLTHERKVMWEGSIRKCPSCGEEVSSLIAFCPSCGHEFNNTEASKILKDFQEGLIKYEGQAERDFVASFPIPNNRESLGNLLITVASILLSDMENGADLDRVTAFSSKFQDIQNRIELVLKPDDPLQKQALRWEEKINIAKRSYESIAKKIRNQKQKQKKQHIKENKKIARQQKIMDFFSTIADFFKYDFIEIGKKILIGLAVLVGAFLVFLFFDQVVIRNYYFDDIVEKILRETCREEIRIIPKENISFDGVFSQYFDITSDATVTIYEKGTGCNVNFKIKCKKSIKDALDKETNAILKEKGLRKEDYNVEFRGKYADPLLLYNEDSIISGLAALNENDEYNFVITEKWIWISLDRIQKVRKIKHLAFSGFMIGYNFKRKDSTNFNIVLGQGFKEKVWW